MAVYEYIADDGERRDIVASMHKPPKMTIRRGGKVFRRIISNPKVIIGTGGEVSHKGHAIPASRSLPPPQDHEIAGHATRYGHKVLELKDGTYATLEGRRIIDNKATADRVAKTTGYIRET